MKIRLSILFVLVFNIAIGQNIRIDLPEIIIGKWYLEQEINDTLKFNHSSKLYSRDIKELKDVNDITIEFYNQDSVVWRESYIDLITFEENFIMAGYTWTYNIDTGIINSRISERFKAKSLRFIRVNEQELVIQKITK